MAGKDTIQILRGTEINLNKHQTETLLDGQPLYDKTNNWLCIGDGGTIQTRQSISVDFSQDALTDDEIEELWGGTSGDGSLPESGGVSSDLISSLQDGYVPYLDGTIFKSTKLYPDADGIRVASTINNQVAGLNWNGAWATDGGSNSAFVAPATLQLMNSLYNRQYMPYGIQNHMNGVLYSTYIFPDDKWPGEHKLAVRDEVDALQSQIDTAGITVRDHVNNLQSQVNDVVRVLNNHTSASLPRLSALEGKANSVDTSLSQLNTQVNTNKNNITSLTTRVSTLESSSGSGGSGSGSSGGGSSITDINNNRFGGIGWEWYGGYEGFNWTSTAGLASGHSGVSDVYLYKRKGDASKLMLVLDIYISTKETLSPKNKSISVLGGSYTTWESSWVPLFPAVDDSLILTGGFHRMEVVSYDWMRDTDTSVGRFGANGYMIPLTQSNTAGEFWYPYVKGIALQLDDSNKNNSLTIHGQHLVVKFYNFFN